eukprot:TRINITY_DN9547_c0_g1_i1.p1 TRINITY_DN9547_c0_g1~~TRINITY_DN9547_c0_g1_i1.p1  ORF type:complete len:161 (+),score=36.13 TRINITY_DN9547_c0_g1_i1:358-840(+)
MTTLNQTKVVEETLTRIAGHKGVLCLLVVSPKDGSVWKSSVTAPQQFDERKLALHAEKLHAFVNLTRSIVRTLDVDNDLIFLRVRSKRHEFIISPEKEYILIVVQDYRLTPPGSQPQQQQQQQQQVPQSPEPVRKSSTEVKKKTVVKDDHDQSQPQETAA